MHNCHVIDQFVYYVLLFDLAHTTINYIKTVYFRFFDNGLSFEILHGWKVFFDYFTFSTYVSPRKKVNVFMQYSYINHVPCSPQGHYERNILAMQYDSMSHKLTDDVSNHNNDIDIAAWHNHGDAATSLRADNSQHRLEFTYATAFRK